MADLEVKRKFKNAMQEKQDEQDLLYGILGNGQGTLYPAGRDNYVYVQLGAQVQEIYNVRVPAKYGIPVSIGIDPMDPQRGNQVLSYANAQAQYAGVDPNGLGYPPAKRYQWMANGGGEDPLFVALRQFLPLRVSPAGGMYIKIYPGMIKLGSSWLLKSFQTIDLSSYVPTTPGKAKLVLISIDNNGDGTVTAGDEVDIDALTDLYNAPTTPINTIHELSFIRLYYGQTRIAEGRVNSDVYDIRLPYMMVVDNEEVGLNSPASWLLLNEITSLDDDDLFLVLDVSANEIKRFKKSNLPSGGSLNYAEVLVDRVLYDNVLESNGIWNIDLSALDAWSTNIDDFEIIVNARSTVSSTWDDVHLIINDDTTLTNYRESRIQFNSSSYTGTTETPTIGTCTGNTAPSGSFGQIIISMANINSSVMTKSAYSQSALRQASTAELWQSRAMEWENTNPITKLKICPDNNPTDVFLTGSRIRILGRQKMNVIVNT